MTILLTGCLIFILASSSVSFGLISTPGIFPNSAMGLDSSDSNPEPTHPEESSQTGTGFDCPDNTGQGCTYYGEEITVRGDDPEPPSSSFGEKDWDMSKPDWVKDASDRGDPDDDGRNSGTQADPVEEEIPDAGSSECNPFSQENIALCKAKCGAEAALLAGICTKTGGASLSTPCAAGAAMFSEYCKDQCSSPGMSIPLSFKCLEESGILINPTAP